jgi:hypothetical protein
VSELEEVELDEDEFARGCVLRCSVGCPGSSASRGGGGGATVGEVVEEEDAEGRTSTGLFEESEFEADGFDVADPVFDDAAFDDDAESDESLGAARFSFGRSSSLLSLLVELELVFDDGLSRRDVVDAGLEFAVFINATFAAR